MRIVGTNHGGYANARNIADLPLHRYQVVRCNNAYRLPNYVYFKLKRRMHPSWPFLHWDGGLVNYDVLHFFNGISLGKKPWLSTFETYLPRWAAYGAGRVEWGLSKLAGTACKRLVALSHCTKDIQTQFLQDYPGFMEAILPKVSILPPPQALLVDAETVAGKASERERRGNIRLAFVGADFFRKGGLELLRAVDSLLQKRAPLQLHIVSTLKYGDYASKTEATDVEEALRIMGRHPQAIFHRRHLPNEEVLTLFRMADIGLLPTWADTYGYAALESMAAGSPVISTDVRALPELNSPQTGWVIPTEKDSWGNAHLATTAERLAFSQQLQAHLIATLEDIIQSPAQILVKGKAALAHVQTHHSPTQAAAMLEEWYDLALAH